MADNGSGAGRRARWLVPVLTFLVGAVLGAAVFALIRPGADAELSGPARDIPVGVAPSGGQITVPASCTQGLERARAALAGGDEAAGALRRLQTAKLQRILNDLQHAQTDVDRLAEQCRQESRSSR
ncbi:hypothetical protein [Nucisporomicrobium flavum]|uniref:hypothetical protein n=1 Tax=Nucisporomicrobium flavum TaxID=2785915 RepID=UPI0018F527A6|nr:hypothetical protein [Nucisporomicrobium flavum]